MPICKIIKEWNNTDNWMPGDKVDISDPWMLVKEGKVILLDDQGKETVPPGTEMKCPICVYTGIDPFAYARHILSHEKKEVEVTEKMEERIEKIINEEKPKRTPEEMKAFRIENLRKAREARQAKVV
jgi:hypothetical protein